MYVPVSSPFHTFSGLLAKMYPHTLGPLAMEIISERGLRRRSAVRYMLRLPVIFHWIDGGEHTEGGFTGNVARDGALIISSRCPPLGSAVRIEVLVPAPNGDGKEIRIECSGNVTRVEDYQGSMAFGVRGYFSDDQLTRRFDHDSPRELQVLSPEARG